MKISYNWLRELVPDLHVPAAEVAQLLTDHSFETVVHIEVAVDPNITVVKITNIAPHPNADRLRLATIDTGKGEITVVCGAPNIAVGQVVPYSSPGAEVYDEHGETFVVTEATIRGVKSPGMLNSLRELGLANTYAGIWVLPPNTPVGSKLAEHVPADVILEADVTPNRAHDCLCMLGMAREVAALLNLVVAEPELVKLPKAQRTVAGFSLEISDAELTPRYMNVLFKNVVDTAMPLAFQARLLAAGARPISPIVDITNYVMFEIGNPTHAFDTAKLDGKTMGVRLARAGEQLMLLDGSEHELPAGTLVITNDDQPVALAGVVGGAGSEVDESTNEILLEVANFHPYTIQKTATALNLRTEAAARFLKGLEPERVQVAAARTAQLLQEICGAKVEGVLDFYPQPTKPPVIMFDPAQVSQLAGVPTEPKQAQDILQRLRCEVDGKNVIPPADRLDLTGEHDLVEEVVRVVGLDKIPVNEAAALGEPRPLPFEIYLREQIRDSLVKQGFTETYNYSFAPEGSLALVNPVAPEQKFLRESLLPGLAANFVKNKAEFNQSLSKVNPSLFEIGHVHKKGEGGKIDGVVEKQYLAVMMEGDEAAMKKVMEHMGVDAPIVQVQAKYPRPLVAFELDLDALIAAMPKRDIPVMTLEQIASQTQSPVQFTELPKYPAVYRDISVLVGADVTVETVQQLIERVGGELIADTDLFDEYDVVEDSQDTQPNIKSLAFHIQYQAPDRTLTDEEVNAVHKKIEEALKSELDAHVR